MNYLFNLGLFDRKTKTQLINKAEAVMLIADIVGDCTLTETIGIYHHSTGERVIEPSFKIETYGIEPDRAREIANKLTEVFNQDEVIMTPFECQSEFISHT